MTDDEQAAVNNDIGAIDKLLEKLKTLKHQTSKEDKIAKNIPVNLNTHVILFI